MFRQPPLQGSEFDKGYDSTIDDVKARLDDFIFFAKDGYTLKAIAGKMRVNYDILKQLVNKETGDKDFINAYNEAYYKGVADFERMGMSALRMVGKERIDTKLFQHLKSRYMYDYEADDIGKKDQLSVLLTTQQMVIDGCITPEVSKAVSVLSEKIVALEDLENLKQRVKALEES